MWYKRPESDRWPLGRSRARMRERWQGTNGLSGFRVFFAPGGGAFPRGITFCGFQLDTKFRETRRSAWRIEVSPARIVAHSPQGRGITTPSAISQRFYTKKDYSKRSTGCGHARRPAVDEFGRENGATLNENWRETRTMYKQEIPRRKANKATSERGGLGDSCGEPVRTRVHGEGLCCYRG